MPDHETRAGETRAGDHDDPRRLFVYNGGFLTQTRIRRILDLAGWRISLGKPGPDDWIGTWGKSPTAPRGEAIAARTDSPILRVEDAFLRSIHPGRAGEPPRGLCLDRRGVHFDSSSPSDLEHLLATHPLDDTALMNRARAAVELIHHAHLSKYNAFDMSAPLPEAPYVLVIDQTRDDASIRHGGANAGTFHEMLVFAQTENPGSRVVIKTHPETTAGLRPGHFSAADANDRITVLDTPVSPLALFQGATAVYTVTSQLGFEAIFAGHRPRVFGQPFYGGWGLSADENPVPRRERRLTRAQLFAAAMILYPTWYDPHFDRLCQLEDVIGSLSAQARAWREDRAGYVATGISRWKRRHMRAFFGQHKPVMFQNNPERAAKRAQATARQPMVWASHPAAATLPQAVQIEDGFIRSRGLGANLIPPLSLVADDLGIYYDPSRESRLEQLITASTHLPAACTRRAENLIRTIRQNRISKYNLPATPPPNLPDGHRILVPGQVEDDASIRLGCPETTTNLGLLQRTRAANPDAVILYKPHPDVQAGLRPGALSDSDARAHADMVLTNASPADLIEICDEVWTLTSLLGFEALLRDKPVTCLGIPFYAGWGLSRDLCETPPRRLARPSLAALTHATLIDYPRYHDMTANLPCTPEVALRRLAAAPPTRPRPLLRLLTRLQQRATSAKP